MKVLDRSENQYILEPLKQYLENEGIEAEVRPEWSQNRAHGPYVLLVSDEFYYDAIQVLDNIDTTMVDDGVQLTDKSGRTAEEIRHRYDDICRWAARGSLIAAAIVLAYLIIRY